MSDDTPEISQDSSLNGVISSDSAPITPLTDDSSASLTSKLALPTSQQTNEIEEEAADNIHPLPSPTKAESTQTLKRATPGFSPGAKGSQTRRSVSVTTAYGGNDWAISPQIDAMNGQQSKQNTNPNRAATRQSSVRSSKQSSRANSIFSVLPFLASSTPTKEEDPLYAESAFVLSRLENSPLDGAEAASPAMWLTDQLKSALRTFNDTVVGEISPGDVDWEFWKCLVENYEETVRSQPKYFTQQLAKGIPESLRGLMWQKITKSRSERYVIMYKSLLARSSKDEKIIIRDLPRTYPTHPYFKDINGEGQASLFNVLKAYSIHDPDIGYCQGIAFVVGPLLLNMTEEESFCVLIQLMREYGFRDLYSPKLIGLQLRLYQYEKLLESKFPKVANHLALLDLKANMYASQWFMTLFAYRFPLEMVFRIMDIVMAEGYDAVLRFSLALIQRNQSAILAMSEFENLLDFLQNGLFDEYIGDINSLIYDAYQIQITKATLDILTNQHNQILRQSSPDYIEVKNLKEENLVLCDKLQFLQADYEAMCVDHAQVMSKYLELEDEVEKLKNRNDELEETVDGLKLVLSDERKGAEAQVQMEMDLLAQKNIRLTNQNAQLEEDIVRLETDLATFRSQHSAAEAKNEELNQKISKFQKLLNPS